MDHGMPSAGVQLENNDERGILKFGPHITIYVTPTQFPPNPSQPTFSPYNYGGNPQCPSVSSYPYSHPGMQNANYYPPTGAGMIPSGPAVSRPTVIAVSQPDPADLVPMQNADHYPPPEIVMIRPASASSHSISSIGQSEPDDLVPIRENYSEQMAFACIIFWLCGFVLGGIAFILAATANCKDAGGQVQKARQLGEASYGLIIAGLIVGVMLWVVFIVAMIVLF